MKMEKEGIAPSAISAFESTFNSLLSGNTGMIPEDTISPVPDLDRAENLTSDPRSSLLSETVVLKLNGGLGTGMGLDKAKSLLKVKGEDTFLDLTAKQVIQMRKDYGLKVKFMLMNSFSTSADTLAFFQEKYPALAGEEGLEMLQNKIPKIRADNYEVSYRIFLHLNPRISNFSTSNYSVISQRNVPLTHPMNGVLPDMVTCTRRWLDQVVWISS
jgi:UTP--glucose-1-phosphate uridylyltransferase